jgi:hypothetical protein
MGSLSLFLMQLGFCQGFSMVSCKPCNLGCPFYFILSFLLFLLLGHWSFCFEESVFDLAGLTTSLLYM